MTYADVTLAPDDIEWEKPVSVYADLQDAVFDDALFAAFVEHNGVQVALEKVTEFHRVISNQLIRRAVSEYTSSKWAGRTIRLCRSIKRRRNELRRWLVANVGQDEGAKVISLLDDLYPRAEWGSDVEQPAAITHPALVRQPRKLTGAEERKVQARSNEERAWRSHVEHNGKFRASTPIPAPHSCGKCRNPYTKGNPDCPNAQGV